MYGYQPAGAAIGAASPGFMSNWGMPGAEFMMPTQPSAITPLTTMMPQVDPKGGAGIDLGGFGAGKGGAGGAQGFGLNMGTANLAIAGLQTLGNLWAANESRKLAKSQFNFARDTANINMNNQIKSYNTALEDRANARGFVQGDSRSSIEDYIARHRASR